MPAFPRTILPKVVTPMRVPTGLVSRGQTGKDQRRAIVSMGREWTETYGVMRVGTSTVDAFLAFLEDAYNQLTVFTIAHLTTPGSGLSPHGAGGGAPLVAGALQTGATLLTDGWSASVVSVVGAGDVIRIAGLSPLFRITAPANSNGLGAASLSLTPPIPSGMSPADNAAITRADCTLNAYLAAAPVYPNVPPGRRMTGLHLTFREAL